MDKIVTTYPNIEGEFYSYEDDVEPQRFNVWFKFGCAHLTTVPPEGSPEESDYIHICEPKEFIKFLQEAIEVSEKEGNSWEQG